MKSATKTPRKIVSKSQPKSKWSLIAGPRRKPWPRIINSTSSCLSNTWLGSMALSPDPSKPHPPRRQLPISQTTQAPPWNPHVYASSNPTLIRFTIKVTIKVQVRAIVVAKANVFQKGLPITSISFHRWYSKVIVCCKISKSHQPGMIIWGTALN